jgi:DNA polymerase-3 subunit beta
VKLSIQRDDLVRLATRAASVADKQNPQPFASAVLLEGLHTGDGLRVTARDAVLTIIDEGRALVHDAGLVAVDAHRLAEVVRVLPVGEVKLATDDKSLSVKAGASSFRIPILEREGFPRPDGLQLADKIATLHTDGLMLRMALRKVAHAVAGEDNRYGLGGVHLAPPVPQESPAIFVATDGTRLAHVEVGGTMEGTPARRTLIPRRAIAELAKMTEGCDATPMRLEFGPRSMVATIASTVLVVRLLEADFPAYKDVLPKSYKERIVVDRDALGQALKRVAIVADDKAHTVRLTASGDQLLLSAGDANGQTARDSVACEVEGQLTVGMNARFLADALAQCPEGVIHLECSGPLGPMTVRGQHPSATFYLVMPVRLD